MILIVPLLSDVAIVCPADGWIVSSGGRNVAGWSAGVELAIEDCDDGLVIRSVRPVAEVAFEEFVGCVGYRGPRRSLEEMEAAIERGARERRGRK